MNKINEFKYLKEWCDNYYKTVGLKIHPANVPVDVILEDIMEHITMLTCHEKQFVSWSDYANEQIKHMKDQICVLQQNIFDLNAKISELEKPIEQPKKGKKNDKSAD